MASATGQRFPHLSPLQVPKFQGRVSLALLDQVSSSGPINFSEGAGLHAAMQTLWMGMLLLTVRHPKQRRGSLCPHQPRGLEGREGRCPGPLRCPGNLFDQHLSWRVCGLIAPHDPSTGTWAAATDFCHERTRNDSPKAARG